MTASTTRKQQIVEIALDLVDEGGTEAVSTTSIAARIGVTQPAVFRHFATKEALWLGMLDWLDDQLREIRKHAVQAEGEEALAALARTFDRHLELVSRRPALAKLVFSDALRTQFPSLDRRFAQLHAGYQADVERLLRAARSSRQMSAEVRTRDAAAVYFALIQGLGFQMSIAKTSVHSSADRKRMFAMFVKAIA
jgi:AcrR family transcriptional regulator